MVPATEETNILTKLTETARTILRSADAGRLTTAAQATINALKQHGHDEQATRVELSMSKFLRGSVVVHIETLRDWQDVFETAADLLVVSDPDLAHRTVYQAGYQVHREIQAYERDLRFLAATPSAAMTYNNLNVRLGDVYEILAALPAVADPALEGRIQYVAQLLDDLTDDTYPDHLDEAGVDPDAPVAAVRVAA